MNKCKKVYAILVGVVILLLLSPAMTVDASSLLGKKAGNCQPGQKCNFGFPWYGDVGCIANIKIVLKIKGTSWTIPANGKSDFNSHFGSLSGPNYVKGLGVPAGCLCEVATMFNYFASVNGMKVNFQRHSADKPIVLSGVPSGYETSIWNPGTTMTITNNTSEDITIHWSVSGSVVSMWIDGVVEGQPLTLSTVWQKEIVKESITTQRGQVERIATQAGSWEKGLETIDEIAKVISVVPSLKPIADTWVKVRKYVPWILALATILVGYIILRFFGGIALMTKWGQRRDRKKKQFFWLGVVEILIYSIKPDPFYLMMWKFTWGIWGFFTLSGLIYRIWRHFNYDPKIEESIKNGGTDNWEWLREAILSPVLLGVLALILAYGYGYYLFPSKIRANEPTPIVSQLQPILKTPQGPNPVPNGENIVWNCNFDPIVAGLGPVEVGCDENGLPTFPIRWWNGNNFKFSIPLRVWKAVLAVTDDPEQILGIIVFGSAESTGYSNYQTENSAGALGTFQFLPGTYKHWAPKGLGDPNNRTNTELSAEAVRNMQRDGMKEIYAIRDMQKFVSCFQGGGGCNTWNNHQDQAEYAWRLMVALRVAAGMK